MPRRTAQARWCKPSSRSATCVTHRTADKPPPEIPARAWPNTPYLAFLDQDDLWEPTFLEATLGILESAPQATLVHCDGYQVNERNEILEYDAAMKQQRSITQLLRGGHDAATSGSLFRKTCFDAVGGYDAALSIWRGHRSDHPALRSGPIHSSSQTALSAPALRTQCVAEYPSLRALDGRRGSSTNTPPLADPAPPKAMPSRTIGRSIMPTSANTTCGPTRPPPLVRRSSQPSATIPTMSKHGRVWSDRILSSPHSDLSWHTPSTQSHALDGRRRNKTGG
jgi:hypothetical protein